ncbi:MAG TPA: alanine--tRNA ligase [Ktedonobacteraceae bacterium]|nr:alanine--tRNA ligase [Ktedonobacteraceae bacterium]
MTGDELRQVFLSFFAERGHSIIPSAPLVPENDPSALFNSAGMQPLVPYLLGEIHPGGRRLADVQKCLRTDDIEEVGDSSHNTFFEMLGFWSLGDYWKQDSLRWTLDWFTQVLGLDLERISVTVFAGDDDAPRDDEAVQVWLALGIPQERIYYLPKKDNWWGPPGATGPCGPDSELFYDTGLPKHGTDCRPGCSCGKYIEIGNNVFMQYNKTVEGTFVPLKQRNIDVGIGLERTLCVHQQTDDVFTTDLFMPIVQRINELRMLHDGSNPDHLRNETLFGSSTEDTSLSAEQEQRLTRTIADHVRAATFTIADGVKPGNVEQGYICRRLIRRAIRCGYELNLPQTFIAEVAQTVISRYGSTYPDLVEQQSSILEELTREEERFRKTLSRGLREFQKQEIRLRQRGGTILPGETVFRLFDTFGFPPTLTAELAHEHGLSIDQQGFDSLFKQHQERSRQANQKKFAGGLADHSERTTRLHTATHLLQQALRDVLGTHVHQVGSNITPERLRFDFSHPKKLTVEEIQRVEDIVNRQIARDLRTTMEVMPLQQALDQGALAFFGDRYGNVVKVYKIGDYSMEVCGGPHVEHTGNMGRFHIMKSESIGQGVQRIRAELVES